MASILKGTGFGLIPDFRGKEGRSDEGGFDYHIMKRKQAFLYKLVYSYNQRSYSH